MLVPALSMVYGGPSLTSVRLADAICRLGVTVDVITTNADGDKNLDVPLFQWIEQENHRIYYFPRWGKWEYKFSPTMAKWLWQHLADYDILHTTSVFNFPVFAGAAIAQLRKVPYVINPAGMLEPWALAYKAWKKRWYYRLIERPRLEHASAIHCLTVPEARRITALGIRAPMVIVANGIDPKRWQTLSDPEMFYERYPDLRGKTLLLFMHRVDPKKGLDILARAFAAVRARLPELPLHLVVAGPSTDNYQSVAEAYFAQMGCAAQVTFTGLLDWDMKRAALAAAAIFVTPTYSEGFSMAVLEAMAAGLPGVMTEGCNFQEAAEAGAAHVTPIESEPFAEALVDLLTHPEAARTMGECARRLVLDQYTWDQAAVRTVAIYTALVRNAPIPYCLESYDAPSAV